MKTLMVLAGLAPILVAVPTSSAQVALSKPGTDGWRALNFPKIQKHTTYVAVQIDGMTAWKAQADCSASAMYLPAGDVDLQRTPRLRWQWRVDQAFEAPAPRHRSGDDFAARVYVMFRFDADHASWWQRAQHALAAAIYGDEIPGNAIDYVWTRREPRGASWDNPFTSAAKMESLGAGSIGQWATETVDVVADYRKLFGYEPPPLLAVAVMTDTDNSCRQAVAYYADFRFLDR
jgi:Protein of unknown function (DUF3047)